MRKFDPAESQLCLSQPDYYSPRVAALAIVRLINSTKVNQAMLALTVGLMMINM